MRSGLEGLRLKVDDDRGTKKSYRVGGCILEIAPSVSLCMSNFETIFESVICEMQ